MVAHVSVLASAVALLLPGFTPVTVGQSGGSLQTGVMPGTERPGYVYLPPGFSTRSRYPVVYLLHGMPGSPSEYVGGTALLQWADAEIAAGRVHPFNAVLPAAGRDSRYNGEWAGPWEAALVDRVVPWVDASLPTDATPGGRILAGLSAGGFGAADIGLRHPGLFGTIEAWGAYFAPLHDGPFDHAPAALLAANDPVLLARRERPLLRRLGTRFFLSTGPAHSHWFRPAQTAAFARELTALGLSVRTLTLATARGEWRSQVDAGLAWALAPRGS